jgi:hypothetical protein
LSGQQATYSFDGWGSIVTFVAIRYACLECGFSVVDAPAHYGIGERGEHVPVLLCPSCNRFYRRSKSGDLVETEGFELDS